ncbi:MAG: hypothetical protein ACJ8AD_09200 [Gemmatimonadaceae bacterium]
MKAEMLETEFRVRSVPSSGNLLLLTPTDAIALVRRAADEGVPILGIHGFFMTPESTESPLEHIADFSKAVANGHGCWQEAEAFIRERIATDLVFELTLGDDPVEAV